MAGGSGNFIQEMRQELKKVTWPAREELVDATVVVIFTTFLMAVFIGLVDFFLSILVRFLVH